MAQRRGFSQAVRKAPRRLTNWGMGPGGTAVVTRSSTGSAILGSGVTFGAAGTVIRTRGHFSAALISFSASGDGFHGAIGVGVASSAAFDTGLAALPTPITEANWDGWLYHSFWDMHGQLAAGATALGDTQNFNLIVDSKAMRKVSDAMTLFAMVEVVEIGTAVVDLFFDSRLLLKEG